LIATFASPTPIPLRQYVLFALRSIVESDDVVTAAVTSSLRHAGKLTSTQKRSLRHVLTRPHKHKDRRGRRPCRQATVGDTNSLSQPSQQLDERNGTGPFIFYLLIYSVSTLAFTGWSLAFGHFIRPNFIRHYVV